MAAAAQVRFVLTADLSHWFHESPVWDQPIELNSVLIRKIGEHLSVCEWVKNITRPDMIALSSQHVNVNFKAVSAGIGMGFIEDYKAKMYGGFHRVLPTNQEWSVPIWLVTHVDLHRTEKVQAMLRCIKSARQEE